MKISWNDRVKNEEELQETKKERNIWHRVKRRRANWIGHRMRRNCLLNTWLKEKIQRRIEVTKKWRRRRKQLLNDLKETKRFCKLAVEALDCWFALSGELARKSLWACPKTEYLVVIFPILSILVLLLLLLLLPYFSVLKTYNFRAMFFYGNLSGISYRFAILLCLQLETY